MKSFGIRPALGLTVLLAAVQIAPVRAQEGSAQPREIQTIGSFALEPGDMVRVTISGEPDLSGEYPVDETGFLALPLIGSVQATGVPPAELKRRILESFDQQIRNQTVQVVLLRRISVLGAVQNAGLYHVDPTMTLVEVVALAGGPSEAGSLDNLRIVRDGRELDVRLDGNTMEQIRSGDQIVLQERGWWSRNTGLIIGSTIGIVSIIIRETIR
ncbi:MAG TPA: polysaccharide biosynthesis/export family protein [Gemmatimonadota bacterium]|nr:polysaccharide biosynthesis/export family protein [Gemmatimonadota bacterium]